MKGFKGLLKGLIEKPFKKNKHAKDEAPIEDPNDQIPENENNISSGSNAKGNLSSGSTHQIVPPKDNESKVDFKAAPRPNQRLSFDRKTYTVAQIPKAKHVKPPRKSLSPENLAELEDEAQEKDVLTTFSNSFSERITINLPLDELNAASLRADVLLSVVKDKAEHLDKSVTETEKKVNEISSQMKSIVIKSRSITQTATVINAKLVNIDDWIDRIGSDKSDFKTSVVEFFVSFFSILTTIFSLMWFSFRRKSIDHK